MDPSFKARDAASYDDVAAPYDQLSELYTGPFAERLLTLAEVRAGESVLDLAAGSGIVSRRVVARGAKCVAADLSEGMLRAAASKTPGLRLVRMDAERSAFRAGSFGVVVSLFGMLHFPDPRAVLEDCVEMLEPGGRLAFAFGSPAPWPLALTQAPRIAADYWRQRRGLLLKAPQALDRFLEVRFPGGARDTETDLATRLHGASGHLIGRTKQAGLTAIETGWMRKRFVVESAEAFWDLEIVFSSQARKQISKLTSPEVEVLRAEFIDDARLVQERSGSLVYDVAATWIRGTKPVGSVGERPEDRYA